MSNDSGNNKEKEDLREAFPANRKFEKLHKESEKLPEGKKMEKVVKGSVKVQKKSLSKKFAGVFLEDDTKNVGSYIFHDVLIPAAKELINDMVVGGLEMMLFGERRGKSSSIRRDVGRSHTSYGSYFKSVEPVARRQEGAYSRRSRLDLDDIIFETRKDAEEVLELLVDNIRDYGMSTIADFYDLVGLTSQFTDNKYGWTELKDVYVVRGRNGYFINLPKVKLLD